MPMEKTIRDELEPSDPASPNPYSDIPYVTEPDANPAPSSSALPMEIPSPPAINPFIGDLPDDPRTPEPVHEA